MPLLYAHPDGNLRVFGTGTAVGPWTPGDTFVHRVTEPNATNTGVGIVGPGVGGLEVINGNVTVAAGQTVENKLINGMVTGTPGGKLRNCVVRGGTPGTMTGHRPLVKVADHTVSTGGAQFEVEFCDIEPETKSGYWDACIGDRGYKITRSRLAGTTDIFGIFTPIALGGYANIQVIDCYSPYVTQWRPDPVNTARPKTHNDVVQFQGNYGTDADVVFDGCALHAVVTDQWGTLPVETDPKLEVFNLVATPSSDAAFPHEAHGTFRYCWFYCDGEVNINLGTIGIEHTRSFTFENNRFQKPGAAGSAPTYLKAFVRSLQQTTLTMTNNLHFDGTAITLSGG